MFSRDHFALTAWDIKQRSNLKRLCFRSFAVGIYGPASPFTLHSWDVKCSRSALLRTYSDFVIRSLNLQAFTHYFAPEPSREVVVTFVRRRSSTEWPEIEHCSHWDSFFNCTLWSGWGKRNLGRVVNNEVQLTRALIALEDESFLHVERVRVQLVDFSELSFDDQMRVDLQTDVMVGPHGAGLTHSIFMRDRAALVSISLSLCCSFASAYKSGQFIIIE